ncbi:MAG: right-handed parallel beta-helix repeat-containing protein [Bacteroidaceae bacterium]|nr:right-handed parallel beta-helix repeat-containing protein [Bacteroidaceae bacterium]
MKRIILLFLISCGLICAKAQTYDYRAEDFEGNEWSVKAQTVTSSRGTWTTNKNIQDAAHAHSGQYALHLADKNGLTSPTLPEGAGALIYYAWDKNRQVYVETSTDNTNWTTVESYKETTDWTKHTVAIYDADVRYVRIRTTSNKDFYIDDLIITKMDGTDADGNSLVTNVEIPYFIQDFENTKTYPQSKEEASAEIAFQVEGQGEWKYLNAYKATNESYITDGSAHDLRMLKNGSYVITPLLPQGVVKLSFNEGRTNKTLRVYSSKDGGESWALAKELSSETANAIQLQDKDINRLKIANESGSDADIDNIIVYAFPEGTPASVSTGDASDVSSYFALVSGSIVNKGDKDIIERGICWSTHPQPTIADNTSKATDDDNFTVLLQGLPSDSRIYYAAYALSLAGVGYGETKDFVTSAAVVPSIYTDHIQENKELSDEQFVYVSASATIMSYGGADVTEMGFCYATHDTPTTDDNIVRSYKKASATSLIETSFTVDIPLLPNTTYYLRAFATNSAGTGYSKQQAFTTGDIELPQYAHKVFYVSPEGDDATADGTEGHPFYHVSRVVDKVAPGDTIFMLAGTYHYTERINIGNSGKKNSGRIALFARGGRVVLDCSGMTYDESNQAIRITASYWHIYGLDIVGAGDNGILIERNKPSGGNYDSVKDLTEQAHDNIIENCSFFRCGDTGLQIKNLGAYNKIINCDSYFNRDDSDGDADGFAVKLSHGEGNYFFGCRAWNNSDDGWDGFIRKEGGFPDDITTTLEECWAFNNGFLEDGNEGKGNGNGFKMGSDEGRNNMIFNRCLAFNNLQKNFDQNHNTGNMILNNCTSYSAKYTANKSHFTYRLDEPVAQGHEIVLHNCVAISDGESDRNKSAYAPYSVGTVTQVTSNLNTLPADYQTIDPSEATAPRSADGTLPKMAFMHIAEGNTKLIDAGSEVVPYEGESRFSQGISYCGAAPDLGCFETGIDTSVRPIRFATDTDESLLDIAQCQNGLIVLTLKEKGTRIHTLSCYSLTGKLLGQKTFFGSTTAFQLRVTEPVIVLRVTGSDADISFKLKMK